MKTVKNKEILVGADFAGFPLKEAVVAHLKAKGWKVTDVGVVSQRCIKVVKYLLQQKLCTHLIIR